MKTRDGHLAPPGAWRHEAAVVALLWALPLVLGLIFVREERENPFFAFQLSDSASYLKWAADMAAGKGFGPVPYFVNPLYLYFLTLLTKLSIASVASIRLVQMLLGSLVYPLVYLAGKRLFGRESGLWAALLALGYGPLLHAASELSSGWLEILLSLLAVLIVGGTAGPGRLLLAGCVCGLAALARPTAVLFILPAAVALFVLTRGGARETWRKRAGKAVLFLAGAAAMIAPVTLRNLIVGGDLVLVSSHGGINFYIGNSPQAGGTFYAPPGFHEDLISINDADARKLAEEAVGHPLSPAAVSAYWFRRGLAFLRDMPGKAARLYLKKLLLTAHSHEVSLNSDYWILRESSLVLKALGLPFALLLAAGLLGLAVSWRRRRELVFLHLMTAVALLTPLVFFVSSRYRLPAAALLAIPAGHALARGRATWGNNSRLVLSVGAAVALAVVLLSYPYPLIRDLQGDSLASSYESLGIHLFDEGRTREAERELRRSVQVRPANKAPHWYLARIREGQGDLEGAAVEWGLAAKFYGPDTSWGREAAKNRDRLRFAVTPLP